MDEFNKQIADAHNAGRSDAAQALDDVANGNGVSEVYARKMAGLSFRWTGILSVGLFFWIWSSQHKPFWLAALLALSGWIIGGMIFAMCLALLVGTIGTLQGKRSIS